MLLPPDTPRPWAQLAAICAAAGAEATAAPNFLKRRLQTKTFASSRGSSPRSRRRTSSIAAICRTASRIISSPALFLAEKDGRITAGVITTVSRGGCLPTVSREGCWVSSARQTAWTNTWFPLLQPLWPVVTMRPPVPVRAQIGRLVRERKRQLWLLTPTKLCEGHAHLPWHPSAAGYGRGAAQVHQAYASSVHVSSARQRSHSAGSQVRPDHTRQSVEAKN